MKYFLDTEFIEGIQKSFIGKGKPTIDLISIGIVSENGREYYAVSKDFNLKEAFTRFQWKNKKISDSNFLKEKEYWLRDNVLNPIFEDLIDLEINMCNKQKLMTGYAVYPSTKFTYGNFKRVLNKFGKTNKEIAKDIRNFIMVEEINSGGQILLGDFFPNDLPKPEFYTYYGAYDWVVFCWLFGDMMDLPKGFPMFSKDLKVMLDDKVLEMMNNPRYPFRVDATKEKGIEFVKSMYDYPDNDNLHNALDDARWNLKLYNFLNEL